MVPQDKNGDRLSEGDMVITPGFLIGLISHFTPLKGCAAVQFVQNGKPTYYKPAHLRRATLEEIDNSELRGVGCNQSQELVQCGSLTY